MKTSVIVGVGLVVGLGALVSNEALAVPAGAYLSSFDGSMVQRFNATTGAYEATIADATSGLNGAIGMTFGHDGKLYVISYNNARVIAYDLDNANAFSTFISPEASASAQDLVYHAGHNKYYLNPDSPPQIDRYGTTGAYEGAEPNSAAFAYRTTLGPDGRLYGTNTSTTFRNVWVYDFNTDTLTSFTDHNNPVMNFPLNLTFGPDGNLYVSDYTGNRVSKFDGVTGAPIDVDFVDPGAGGLNGATGATFGPDGNLYVSSRFTDQVLRYDGATGAFIDVFIAAGAGGLDAPQELIFVTPIPEPASAALIAAGGLLLMRRRRRA
jgi:hypothetical protein